MEPIEALAWAVMTAYGVALSVTVAAVLARRRLQPLKARDPYLLIAANASTFVSCLFQRAPACWLSELSQAAFIALSVFVLARYWKLFLAASLTKARLSGDLNVWILRRPWLASSRFVWASAVAVIGALSGAHAAVAMLSPSCRFSQSATLITTVIATAWWLAVAVLTVRLRHVQDGFYLATELRALGVWIVVGNFCIVFVVSCEFADVKGQLVLTALSIGHMAIQMWFPLFQTYRLERRADLRDPDPVLDQSENAASVAPLDVNADFLQILQHPDGFAALQTFLTLEFSVENLLLWKQLHDHRDLDGPDQIEEHFRQIYDLFIRDQAPNEVNISSHLKSQFRHVLNQDGSRRPPSYRSVARRDEADSTGLRADVMSCLLQQLYFDITELIKDDSYRRFKQSDQYQHMLRLSQNRIAV